MAWAAVPPQPRSPPPPQTPQRAYSSAVQAGLSPSPFSPSYQTAFDFSAVPFAPGTAATAAVNLSPELTGDELAWLRYVRTHELLPYVGGGSADASGSSAARGEALGSPTSSRATASGVAPAATPGTSVGYALLLNRVTGVRLPPHLEKESRSSLRFRVQISLFDTESKCFFGRTWSGPLQALGSGGGGNSLAIGPQLLYFRHSLHNEYVVAVCEYVLAVVQTESGAHQSRGQVTDDEVIIERYGIGWTVLNLHSRDRSTLGDVNHPAVDLREDPLAAGSSVSAEMSLADSSMNINQTPAQMAAAQAARMKRRVLTRQLWAGTPRALLLMDKVSVATPQSMSDFSKQLTKAVGTVGGGGGGIGNDAPPSCQLSYELFLCRALQGFFHLFRENEFLGPNDILGGLPLTPATNPANIARKIGFTRGAVLPQNPRLLSEIVLPSFTLRLTSPQVQLPAGYEASMLASIGNIRNVQWGEAAAASNPASGGNAAAAASGGNDERIVSRSLLVGLHNGRKYIKAPFKLPLVLDDSDSSNSGATGSGDGPAATRLRFEGEFRISDVLCAVEGDPSIAVTFELVYELRWPQSPIAGLGLAQQQNATTTITAAWSVALLSNAVAAGQHQKLHLDGTVQTLVLQRGPGRTLSNARVYGFATEAEERRRAHPSSCVVLSVALESSSVPGAAARPQQGVTSQPGTVPSSPMPPPQSQRQLMQHQQTVMSPPAAQRSRSPPPPQLQIQSIDFPPVTPQQPFSPVQRQQQQGQGQPNMQRSATSPVQPHGQLLQPHPPSVPQPQVHSPQRPVQSARSFGGPGATLVQQQQQQQQQSGFVQQHAQGMSVGIQAGPDVATSAHFDDLGSSRGAGGFSQSLGGGGAHGYARVLQSPTRAGGGGGERWTTGGAVRRDMLLSASGGDASLHGLNGSSIQLAREWSDPLRGAEFTLAIDSFSQNAEDFAAAPVQSLVFGFRLFDQSYYRSPRVEIQFAQSSQREDKLFSSESFVTSTNTLNAASRIRVSPFLHRLFVEFLYSRSVDVDVWDGDSLFLLGTMRVPLAQFLRQGSPHVQRTVQGAVRDVPLRGSLFDEVRNAGSTGAHLHSTLSSSGAGSSSEGAEQGTVRGLLTLTITHVGLEVDPNDEALVEHTLANTVPSVTSSRLSGSTATGGQTIFGSTSAGSPHKSRSNAAADVPAAAISDSHVQLNTRINRPSRRRVKTILESEHTDPAFVQTLRGRQGMGHTGQMDELARSGRGHPLSRSGTFGGRTQPSPIHRKDILNASLAASLGASTGASHLNELSEADRQRAQDELNERAANLRKMRAFRDAHRSEAISEMLRGSSSAVRTIYPSYGSAVFFEMGFKNPYPRRTKFRVRIEDPLLAYAQPDSKVSAECTVVTDMQEWLHLKAAYGLATPTSTTLFSGAEYSASSSSLSRTRTGGRQDILSPTAASRSRSTREESKENDSSLAEPRGSVTIVLEGGETVYIPIKFQSFQSGTVSNDAIDATSGDDSNSLMCFPSAPNTRLGSGSSSSPLRHRVIQINLDTLDDPASTVAFLRVDVRPQGFLVDRTLRFHHWADDILKDVIELPRPSASRQALLASTGNATTTDTYITPSAGVPLEGLQRQASAARMQSNMHIRANDRIVKVTCSSDAVAFDFVAADGGAGGGVQEGGAADLSFRLRMGSYPSLQRFYLCLYTDIYAANLHSIVQVLCYAHLRAELSAVVGQRTTGRIFLPPTDRPRRVSMCASSPELSFGNEPVPALDGVSSGHARSAPFILSPGTVNTLDYVYQTTAAGKRSMLIHLVDEDSHQLVQSWALFVAAVYPRVSNTFNVSLRVGQRANKQFDYENAYRTEKTYTFHSSAPDRVKLREETVRIPPLAVRSVHLLIAPQSVAGTDVVFIFINDEAGHNEECLQFNINYKQ